MKTSLFLKGIGTTEVNSVFVFSCFIVKYIMSKPTIGSLRCRCYSWWLFLYSHTDEGYVDGRSRWRRGAVSFLTDGSKIGGKDREGVFYKELSVHFIARVGVLTVNIVDIHAVKLKSILSEVVVQRKASLGEAVVETYRQPCFRRTRRLC